MLTCADCKAIDCANVGIDTNACDNFTRGGDGAKVPVPLWSGRPEDELNARILELEEEVARLRAGFDGLLTAIVRYAQGDYL